MTLLLASLAALLIGPLALHSFGRAQWFLDAVDAFVVVAIGGLVQGHILPHSFESAGFWAVAAAVLGMVAPLFMHHSATHTHSHAQGQAHNDDTRPVMSAAVLALALHAFFDGIALGDPSATHAGAMSEASFLAWAVVLHRVLEGLAIWWLVAPSFGARPAMAAMVVIGFSTIGGFVAADLTLSGAPEGLLAGVQAAVAGALLHVLLWHAPEVTRSTPRLGRPTGIGAAVGLGLVLLLGRLHGNGSAVLGITAMAALAARSFIDKLRLKARV